MADDTTKPDADAKKADGTEKPDLGDAGKKALDAERKARRDAEKALADVQKQLTEIQDKDKSEVEKLREENAALTAKLSDADARALRLEVASEKGLTAGQAKRLVGTTKEELEVDADELLADFTPKGGDEKKPPPGGRPREQLRGGGDPTEEPEETDPRKLADLVPRI